MARRRVFAWLLLAAALGLMVDAVLTGDREATAIGAIWLVGSLTELAYGGRRIDPQRSVLQQRREERSLRRRDPRK